MDGCEGVLFCIYIGKLSTAELGVEHGEETRVLWESVDDGVWVGREELVEYGG